MCQSQCKLVQFPGVIWDSLLGSLRRRDECAFHIADACQSAFWPIGVNFSIYLYFLFPLIAGQGIGVFDPQSGTLTIDIDSATTVVTGAVGFAGTFAAGRWAKVRGGFT